MPISRYNQAFGGKSGSAQKAFANMKAEYGEKKGTSVFYATVNKRKAIKKHLRKRRHHR